MRDHSWSRPLTQGGHCLQRLQARKHSSGQQRTCQVNKGVDLGHIKRVHIFQFFIVWLKSPVLLCNLESLFMSNFNC